MATNARKEIVTTIRTLQGYARCIVKPILANVVMDISGDLAPMILVYLSNLAEDFWLGKNIVILGKLHIVCLSFVPSVVNLK